METNTKTQVKKSTKEPVQKPVATEEIKPVDDNRIKFGFPNKETIGVVFYLLATICYSIQLVEKMMQHAHIFNLHNLEVLMQAKFFEFALQMTTIFIMLFRKR